MTSTTFTNFWVGDTTEIERTTGVGGTLILQVWLLGQRTDIAGNSRFFVRKTSGYELRDNGAFDGWWIHSVAIADSESRTGGTSANVDVQLTHSFAKPVVQVKVNSGETWQFTATIEAHWRLGP